MQILTDTKIDFMGWSKTWFIISATFVAISIGSMLTKGFNLGVEFTGGTQITARFKESVTIGQLRTFLLENDLKATPVAVGAPSENQFIIRVEKFYAGTGELGPKMRTILETKFGEAKVSYWNYDPELGDRAEVRFEQDAVTAEQVGATLKENEAALGVTFERVESDRTGTIAIQLESLAREVVAKLVEKFGAENVDYSIEAIGPGVSRDLKVKGFLSLIFACLLILVYVWLRFDWDFAPGAVIALAHDAIVTAGLFSILGKTFDLSIVAAILALIGYSVNDTVVIYDRIRENIEKLPGKNFPDIINISVNETLSRSVITSGATLITTVFIWLMGGPTLEGFGFALTVGIIAGSYSTIFVASPLIIVLRNLQGRRRGTAGKQPTPAAYRSAS